MSKMPLIYSELLSNIRQISVIVALDTPCNASTKVELSVDGQQFSLSHDGEITTLDLPGQVSSNAQLQRPVIGKQELSWRLPVAANLPRASEDAQSNEAPWSAASLTEHAEFLCRDCGFVVVKRGSIGNWKDLPSENWAEMMDFWHCHKPDVPHTHGSSDQPAIPDKGYGANSKFSARPGVGFVDLTTFLISDTDCVGLQHSPPLDTTSPPSYQPLACPSCTHYLGYYDTQGEGIRLYKWRLSLSNPSAPAHTSSVSAKPSLASILSAHLFSIVQSQCVSRILVTPHPSRSPIDITSTTTSEAQPTTAQPLSLSLWIFAPTLRFSSSLIASSTLATKVFHQPFSQPTHAPPAYINTSNNTEELFLPSAAITELETVLKESACLLPPSARRFQGWEVGLLERFEG